MKSHVFWTGLWFALIVSGALTAHGKTIHVSLLGNDTQDGLSWDTARQTLPGALAGAGDGDTVLIGNGCYRLSEEIVITKAVTLKSMNGRDSVVIAGDFPQTTNRCFVLRNPGIVLEGLTLSNGCAVSGGAVFSSGGGRLRDCLILNNMATYRGGGIYFQKGGLVENCCLFQNTAGNAGGGIFCGEGGEIRHCSFGQNRCEGEGGGIWLQAATLVNCTLMENRADNVNGGGGVRTYYGGRLEHCLVYNNYSSSSQNSNQCLHMATNLLCASAPVMEGSDNFPASEFIAAAEKRMGGAKLEGRPRLERWHDCWQADLAARLAQAQQELRSQAEALTLIRQSPAYARDAAPLLQLADSLGTVGAHSAAPPDEVLGVLISFYQADFSERSRTLQYKIMLDRLLE